MILGSMSGLFGCQFYLINELKAFGYGQLLFSLLQNDLIALYVSALVINLKSCRPPVRIPTQYISPFLFCLFQAFFDTKYHGWPSPQAEVKTEAEAHQGGAAQAKFISLFHQITRACI